MARVELGRLAIGALAFAGAGCFASTGASLQQLRARATFDLQCPLQATEFVELDARTQGVRGCGKQMVYVEVCDSRPDGWHCTWVLNAPAWYVAPERIPPRPDGTWWWTEPQGVPTRPGQPSPPVAVPPVPSQGRPEAASPATPGAMPSAPPVAAMPAPAPFVPPPSPVPLPPLAPLPTPKAPGSAPAEDRGF